MTRNDTPPTTAREGATPAPTAGDGEQVATSDMAMGGATMTDRAMADGAAASPSPSSRSSSSVAPEAVTIDGARLLARDATIGYEGRVISEHLDVEIPDRSFTVIVGPNACGKSTLLRGLSRLLKPSGGEVVLDGKSIHDFKAKEVARRLGLLPQTSLAPDGITVADLVARGRFPHQGLLRQWTRDDEHAVARAMAATGVTALSGRLVDELSGGQRQRVWVAMVLAQQTDILLLDEPTTFLDIAYQIELLELFTDLHEAGHTLVAVLHDLNHAARYASHLIAMKDGEVVAQGAPADVVTAELIEEVFGLSCLVVPDPVVGTPQVVPLGRRRSGSGHGAGGSGVAGDSDVSGGAAGASSSEVSAGSAGVSSADSSSESVAAQSDS